MARDPYEVLGVPSTATEEQIRGAYRELAKKYHPDNFSGNPLSDLAEEKMKEINEAYDTAMGNLRSRGSAGAGGGDAGSHSAHKMKYLAIRRLINTGKIDDAESQLDEMVPSERTAEWYYLKGLVYVKRGWMEQAATYFDKASAMEPGNTEYRNAAAQVNWQRSGNYGTPPGQNGSGGSGPYRNTDCGGCSGCDLCTGLCCADTCCECMGGDLCSCC